MTAVDSASLEQLLGWAALVEARVRSLVAAARTGDPNPDDPFRGLYLSEEAVDRLLRDDAAPDLADDGRLRAELTDRGGRADADGQALRLGRLARDAALIPLDVELLVTALLPDLDARFERLYGYLNDDVTRRRASVGLALRLAGASALDAAARARFEPSRPLVRHGLVVLDDTDRPLLSRAIRVPDRVTAHLLGDDAPDAALSGVLGEVSPYASPRSAEIASALAAGVGLVHLRERTAGSGAATAVAALAASGRPAVVLDLVRLVGAGDVAAAARLAVREALLAGAGLVAEPVEALAEGHLEVVRRLAAADVPVLLVGTATWDPRWSSRSPLAVEAPVLSVADRVSLWSRELAQDDPTSVDAAELAGHLALGPEQVRRAVAAGRLSARLRGGVLVADDLRRGVRAQNAAGLERLARRIEPEVGWDDLVLAPPVRRGLEDLTARARHRDTVLSGWRMRRGGGRGRGVTALFAGDSGTGKTMSAEVIAADLQLDLYTVNLATVVDKYIGETEKNLERIFVEAGGVNAVLFFDEADAIFGKRSDVKDAHDRYANIESAYLLQRLETFDGLAVLATNLRANIDDAFTRRLDAIIDFPAPTPELRRSLWQRCLAPPLPVADDLDLDFLSGAFELAGGNIRSASTTAAYLAAAAGTAVTMAQVIAAVEQEYRKLGRLVLEREFGRYFPLSR
ncbi:ATP-binding protein [uncultured Friedmanniella sp.]|uniref:ATP-binding protein n=1 Tax=uncultured Friedmanniella sp. TaxID=335381 RepID=UPI0035CC428A